MDALMERSDVAKQKKGEGIMKVSDLTCQADNYVIYTTKYRHSQLS